MVHGAWAQRTVFQLSLIGSSNGQSIVNVHHFQATPANEALLLNDGLAQTSAQALVNDWQANLQTLWLACHLATYSLVRRRVQVLERPANVSHRLVAIDDTDSLPAAGTFDPSQGAVGLQEDQTAAAVIRWATAVAGRSHRGRSYVGPISSGQIDNGVIAATAITAINAYAQAMITRYTGAGAGSVLGWDLGIYSRPYSNTGLPAGQAPEYQYTKRTGSGLTVITPPDYNGNFTNATGATVDTTARVQRRRELGVGS